MQIAPIELSLPIVKVFLYNTIIFWPVMRKQNKKENKLMLTRLTVEAKMLQNELYRLVTQKSSL